MKTFKLPIDKIIAQMGYSSSSNLFMTNQIHSAPISSHFKRILNAINPYAMYVVNNVPFILFFDKKVNDNISFKTISKQVWNAQIPVAIFCDEASVKIFNGLSIDISTYTLKLIESCSLDNCNEDSNFSYWQISDPMFWNKYIQNYSGIKLNQYLLSNISFLANELKNTYHIPFSTKLVLRLIFIRYLIDRGVDLDYGNFSTDIEKSQAEFLKIIHNKESVYELFTHLKSKFNGNLFELGSEINYPELDEKVFTLLYVFFSGGEIMNCNQLSFFALYDFNIIPVELISNIYEILLGEETRNKDNAFYTPNYLVEYILDRTVMKTLKEKRSFKILDPSCGSGVFLVDSYRRMVQENLGENLYCDNDAVLEKLLTDNIYGIDINEEAIDVTIFSLYLTILDYKDPKTLSKFTLPNLKGNNLFVSDFFDNEALRYLIEKNISFDYIIGNPPWGSVKNGMHLSYCKTNGYLDKQQNNEICRSFVFRAKDFSSENTVCCFILHSKLLYNQKKQAINFRKFLLKETEINSIIELSSVRKLVFENANAPAAVIAFRYTEESNLNNRFTYISVKPNIFFKLFHIICIEKNDVKNVPQSLLYNYDWAWKTIVYGFSGDIENIIKLKRCFPTIKESMDSANPPIIYGSGIQANAGDAKTTDLIGLPLLDSKNGIDHFLINFNENNIFSAPEIHRTRNINLFNPPHCFTAKGLNCNNFKMRSAYSDKKMICKEAIYVIKSEEEQKDILLNLVGLLNSSLYAYLNLMIGSSLGIEREQRLMTEVLSFPYIYSQQLAEKVEKIQKANIILNCENQPEIEHIDKLIFDAIGLNDNPFVDYAISIQIPELANSDATLAHKKVSAEDLKKYSDCFVKQFSELYNPYGKYAHIILYPDVNNQYSIFELYVKDSKPEEEITVSSEISKDKKLLSKFSVHSYNDKFYELRDVIHFSDNSFFIIKSNMYKNWHPAIAEIDLADVISQIMFSDGGDE